MADIITHAFFATDVADKCGLKRLDMMKLFSYGPDPFYFLSKTKKYATLMHTTKSLEFFKNLVLEIKNRHLTNDLDTKACLYGFLCHYALDTNIHPFVIYKTGYKQNKKAQIKCMDKHRELELYLDRYITENRIGKFRTWKAYYSLFETKVESKVLIDLLNEVFYKTYQIENGGKKYVKALNTMKFTFKHLRYDPHGIKYAIYSFINIFYHKANAKNMSFYKIKDQDLNLNHQEWKHPLDRETYHASAIDLYIHALGKAVNYIEAVDQVLNDNKDIDTLDEVLKNLSYLTGRDINEGMNFKYFEE